MIHSVCRDPVNDLLLWHVSGSLEGAEDASVRVHLTQCGICAREVEVLGGLAASMSEHPDVLRHGAALHERAESLTTDESHAVAGLFAIRWAWGTAAALIVPALLGFYWLYLGLPMADRTISETVQSPQPRAGGAPPIATLHSLRPAVQLDLGGGPRRDTASAPTLTLPPQAESILISFRIPPRSDGRFSVAIEDREGRPLTQPADLSLPDPVGRHIYTLSADLLRPGGEFDLVLRFHQETDVTFYRYPFRVEPVPPTGTPR